MTKLLIALLLAFAGFLTIKQYKFNLQVEWFLHNNGSYQRCQQWEDVIPTEAKAQYALHEITKASYNDWMKNIEKDQRESCDEMHAFHELHSKMPFTPDWVGWTVETHLDSLSGWFLDLFKKPFKADPEAGPPHYKWNLPPTVRLKNHWYGGGDAECYISYAEQYHGMPLPGLSRWIYGLDCKNDKSKKEGMGGFVAVSTSDNLESL